MENLTILGINISEFVTIEKLLRFAALLFIGLPIVFLLRTWIKKYVTKKISPQQGMVLSKVVFYSGILIILFSLLNELNFKMSHLLGAAGIIGIAIGFASQTSVSNIVSGIFLIGEKSFQVNDIIKVGETTGVVLSIDTLSIKLRTFDNKFVRIPNETIIKSEVTNITKFPIRRVDLNISVAYKEDIARVREVLLNVAHKNPLCLNEPEPLVIFSNFGNSSIDLLFIVWAVKTDWLMVKNSMFEEIKKSFDEEKIEIPFPHVSLYRGSATEPFPVSIVQTENNL
jgi:small-conductance mechanosensitive channel